MAELSDRLKGIGAVLIGISITPLYIANGAWRGIVTRNYKEFRDYVDDGWQVFKYAYEDAFRGKSLENERFS